MIKASDIRSGNQILYNIADIGKPEQWEYYTVDWQDIEALEKNNTVYNDFHKPIPITPEALEKVGFKKKKDLHNTWEIEILKAELLIRIFPDAVVIMNTIIPIELKGFHHLQNILYDLCSIEFKIMKEEFKTIPEFPDYMVSNMGRVKELESLLENIIHHQYNTSSLANLNGAIVNARKALKQTTKTQ